MSGWQPTAPHQALRARARALALVRGFFADRGVLEVETPALVRHAVTDVQLQSARVQLPGFAAPLYLHTSPEYAMKRLLAAGSGDVYQIAHVFRGAERSPLHNPEFTLLEWYRCGMGLHRLIDEVAELTGALLAGVAGESTGAPERLRYAEAFERVLGCDPIGSSDTRLRACAIEHGLELRLAGQCTRDELLDWLMGWRVGPTLGQRGLCFLYAYPASQAALARLDPEDPRVALRFELYCRGIELANGFEELTDAAEQRRRFEADGRERRRRGLEQPEPDESLLAALAAGLPPVSGVALGLDRVLMLQLGARDIREVLAFPTDRA